MITYADTARTVYLTGVSQITTGEGQRCAILQDGGTDCWGLNEGLELGLPATTDHAVSPVGVPALSSKAATQISAGTSFSPSEDHTCARLQGGTVACWGADDVGQLGNGLPTRFADPVLIPTITTAVQVSAAGEHSCAVLLDGTVTCWGANESGQLGNGTTSPSATPVPVSGITTAVQVAAGEHHTCALLQDGTVKCWGDDAEGELGNGHAGNAQGSSRPSRRGNLPRPPATQIAAGGYDTCVVMQDHTISCWGQAEHGQLGNGVKFPYDSSPVPVSNITNATDVTVGQDYACDVGADGRVSCWGSDLNGQLGNTTDIAIYRHRRPDPRRCAQRRRRETGQRRRRHHVRNARRRHRRLLGRRLARRRDLELTPQPGERDRTARKLTTNRVNLHAAESAPAHGKKRLPLGSRCRLIEMLGGSWR